MRRIRGTTVATEVSRRSVRVACARLIGRTTSAVFRVHEVPVPVGARARSCDLAVGRSAAVPLNALSACGR